MSTVSTVSSRAAMAALASPTAGTVVYLTEADREGLFECLSGSSPALDALQGLYITSTTASFYWARAWDGINGRPEWFGATPNNGGADCLSALQACFDLCPVTLLGSKDYWISSTWIVDKAYRSIIAEVNSDQYDTGHGTRLICTNASQDVMQIGPSTVPAGGIANFTRSMKVSGLAVLHSAGVNPPPAGQETNGVCGFRVQYIIGLEAENLTAAENIIGFRCYGVVGSHFRSCSAFRSANAINTGNPDLFYGWYLQGSPPVLAGGNASIYFDSCSTTVGGSPALPGGSIGLYATGNFVDTFIRDFESSALRKGIVIDGQDWNGAGQTNQVDFRLENPVLDTCSQIGIEIVNTNKSCQMEIINPYIGLLAGGTAGMRLNQTGGQIRLQGGRMIGSGDAPAWFISQTDGVEIDGCAASGFGGNQICYVEYSKNFRLLPSINSQYSSASVSALYVRNSSIGYVAPAIKGQNNAFPQGIYLQQTTNSSIVIDPTRIDSACLVGGANAKVIANGLQLTSPGYYATTGLSGVAGAGIQLTGITK